MNRWVFAAMLSFVSLPACVRLHAPERMELGRESMPRADAAISEAGSSEVDAWIRVMRPRAASEARGICVLLPGILGSHSSPTSEHRLREDGWHVVVVAPPLVSSVLAEMRTGSTDDRVEMGARVGRSVDAVILRAAEATRREIGRVRAAESSLAGKPVILVGESLGALMGVGVAAAGLIPCDAALFVAGGGSLVDVAAESSLRRILFGDLPVGDPLFRSGFEAASRFDSLAAARRLRGCPVVCVTAAIDLIVPVRAQEALWTALGEPPRYRFDGGHLELFVFAEWNILPAIRDVAACAGAALPSAP